MPPQEATWESWMMWVREVGGMGGAPRRDLAVLEECLGRSLLPAERKRARRQRLAALLDPHRPTPNASGTTRAPVTVACTRATRMQDMYVTGSVDDALRWLLETKGGGAAAHALLGRVCTEVWGSLPRRRLCKYTLCALHDFLQFLSREEVHGLDDDEAAADTVLRDCDGPRLRAFLEAARVHLCWTSVTRNAVRAVIHRYKVRPMVDPDGRFQSHLHAVSADFMAEYPPLWAFPWPLARRLSHMADPEDVSHLLLFLQDVSNRRLLRLPSHRNTLPRVTVLPHK